jgi:CBS domain-containing protein
MSRAEAFLAAFHAIEHHLRRIGGTPARLPFYRALDEAARRSPEARRFADDLREYADLRNAIVHSARGDEPIAEPHRDVVEHLQRILASLTDPPRVLPLFKRQVITVGEAEPVARAVEIMYAESISQVPVMRGAAFEALLTTKTVTRWLGASVAEDLFSLLETPVAHVLRFAEGADSYAIIASSATLAQVMDRFHDAEVGGSKLQALFISQRGKPTDKLLGVITTADLSLILDTLEDRTGAQRRGK